jgi:hypothetical protein
MSGMGKKNVTGNTRNDVPESEDDASERGVIPLGYSGTGHT